MFYAWPLGLLGPRVSHQQSAEGGLKVRGIYWQRASGVGGEEGRVKIQAVILSVAFG